MTDNNPSQNQGQPNFFTIDPNISQQQLEEMAMNNNNEAQYLLYKLYSKMKTPDKILQASELLAKSADAGFPPAQYKIGKFLLQGKIFSRNQVRGMGMLNQSANGKYTPAIIFLAHVHENGYFVKKDSKTAVLFYQKAAQNGSGSAENALGSFYQKGIMGLPLDIDQAIEHYRKAVDFGHSIAKFNLSILLRSKGETEKANELLDEAAREGVPQAQFNKTLTMNKTTQKHEIMELLKSAAEKGLTKACYSYGCMLQSDNPDRAIKYLKKAANDGHPYAQLKLSFLLKRKDPIQSRQYLEEAMKSLPVAQEEFNKRIKEAKGNDPESLFQQYLYLRNENHSKAMEVLKKSADTNHRDAMLHLASEYDKGEITEPNYEKSAQLLQMLVDKSDGSAENNLGRCYELGRGVKQDKQKAQELYKLSYEHQCVTGGLYYARTLNLQKHHNEAGRVYQSLYDKHKDPAVSYFYGRALVNGHCGDKDSSGVELIKKAADAGFPTAIHNYGVMLYYGDGVKKDVDEAIKLFRECAKQPKATYKFALAQILMNGYHVDKNEKEALELLEDCIKENFMPAIVAKAKFLMASDKEKAIELLKPIAEAESTDSQYKDAQGEAQYIYANCLKELGQLEEAKKMFQSAAMMGNTEAMNALLSL